MLEGTVRTVSDIAKWSVELANGTVEQIDAALFPMRLSAALMFRRGGAACEGANYRAAGRHRASNSPGHGTAAIALTWAVPGTGGRQSRIRAADLRPTHDSGSSSSRVRSLTSGLRFPQPASANRGYLSGTDMTPPFRGSMPKAGTVQIDTLSFLPTEAKATGRTLNCSTLRGMHPGTRAGEQ